MHVFLLYSFPSKAETASEGSIFAVSQLVRFDDGDTKSQIFLT